MPDISVTETISADPEDVYRLVSDVTQMGQWSPENTGARWLGGASRPVPGARFRGTNKRGFRRWSTTCTVTDAEPGRRFGFDVAYGPLEISHWEYELTPGPDGCRVTENWTDCRPGWMRVVGPRVMGVRDQAEHNREGMRRTLAALKLAAESAVSDRPG